MYKFSIKPIRKEDLSIIYDIQVRSYDSRYVEEKDNFLEIISFYEEGCLCVETNGIIIAYVLSFPWIRGIPAPLTDKKFFMIENFKDLKDTNDNDIHKIFDCYYIHDLCVSPEYRSMKVGKSLFESVISLARQKNFKIISLTSVQGSRPFLEQFGFYTVKEVDYGGSTAYLMETVLQ
jgi:ribosomal protein S18 acetylase RimI-like enzyme